MATSKDIKHILEENGWACIRSKGDHFTFKHKTNPNLITIVHPRKDNPIGYIKYIERVSGLKLR